MMVLNQQLLANFGLTAVPALGVLSVSSMQAETEPRVYSGMTYATLGGGPDWFWHLAIFVSSHLSILPSAGGSDPRVEILCG
jgi:hypothetical protein